MNEKRVSDGELVKNFATLAKDIRTVVQQFFIRRVTKSLDSKFTQKSLNFKIFVLLLQQLFEWKYSFKMKDQLA